MGSETSLFIDFCLFCSPVRPLQPWPPQQPFQPDHSVWLTANTNHACWNHFTFYADEVHNHMQSSVIEIKKQAGKSLPLGCRLRHAAAHTKHSSVKAAERGLPTRQEILWQSQLAGKGMSKKNDNKKTMVKSSEIRWSSLTIRPPARGFLGR